MHMILMVLDDGDRLGEVLDAWEAVGVRDATILESTGVHRRKRHLAMRYAFDTGIRSEGNMTLLAIVPSAELVDACLAATEAVIGDLSGPDTGVFTSWPLSVTKGVPTPGERR